jgi:hypothetical protein
MGGPNSRAVDVAEPTKKGPRQGYWQRKLAILDSNFQPSSFLRCSKLLSTSCSDHDPIFHLLAGHMV